MTNQPTNQPQRPQHREDYKVQKLMKRIEFTLVFQSKALSEGRQVSSKN